MKPSFLFSSACRLRQTDSRDEETQNRAALSLTSVARTTYSDGHGPVDFYRALLDVAAADADDDSDNDEV